MGLSSHFHLNSSSHYSCLFPILAFFPLSHVLRHRYSHSSMTSILTLRRHGGLFTRAGASSQKEQENASASPRPEYEYPRLHRFEDLPVWYQDNPSIRSGYRPVSYSSQHCFHSWTFLHNETINIYTHLIPALFSIFAQITLQAMLTRHFPQASFQDRLIFSLNLLAGTAALLLSSIYHTLMNHSFHIS